LRLKKKTSKCIGKKNPWKYIDTMSYNSIVTSFINSTYLTLRYFSLIKLVSKKKNMYALEHLGEIDKPMEKIKSQVMVNIIEGRNYYKNNVDTYVTVEIPSYFLSKTPTKKTSTSPSYFNVTLCNYILTDVYLN